MGNEDLRPYGLAHEQNEELCKSFFPYKEITPEEYIKRPGVFGELMASPYHLYNYRDIDLDKWIGKLREVFTGYYAYFDNESLKQEFPYLSMSPEEYAARHSHTIACFGLHFYRYRDQRLEKWLLRLGEIIFDEKLIDHYRKTLLTPEEIARIETEAENMEF